MHKLRTCPSNVQRTHRSGTGADLTVAMMVHDSATMNVNHASGSEIICDKEPLQIHHSRAPDIKQTRATIAPNESETGGYIAASDCSGSGSRHQCRSHSATDIQLTGGG